MMWDEGDSYPNDNVHCVSEWMELGREGGWHLRSWLRGYCNHKVIRVGLGYNICVWGFLGQIAYILIRKPLQTLLPSLPHCDTPLKLPPKGYMSLPIEKQWQLYSPYSS